jgi:predicted phage terminase large subunit-like protein
MMAYRVAWEITRNPAVTILYISSTANLAEKQLKAVQDILTSPVYKKYWPEMVEENDGKREKWTNSEICIDHPIRKREGVRDSTIFTAGLTTSITGLHCDIAVLDDVVVQENAYTEEGRSKVRTQYSLLSSIENPGAQEWVVGTRYDSRDLYQDLIEMAEDIYDEEGEVFDSANVYEVFERVVEVDGEFIWPRQKRSDGKWFGFNWAILNKKRAQYLDKKQFYAQYYNNPNDPTGNSIDMDWFQYYDRKHITHEGLGWAYKGTPLSVFAAIDFAFSRKKKADYTAIVVLGMDADKNIYVLDIERFKTERIAEYFDAIVRTHSKWGYRKLRAEVNGAQKGIVAELKEQYIKPNGLVLKVDEYVPSRHEGSKEERMEAALVPRYENGMIYHYKGGNCQILEEEVAVKHPPHDDVKDAFTAAINIATPPRRRNATRNTSNVVVHARFGGVN